MPSFEACCYRLVQTVEEEEIMIFQDSSPFSNDNEGGIFIISDAGHGGWARIHYCPFCGEHIRIM